MLEKYCTKCKKFQPIKKFRKDKQKKDGYYSSCTDCYRKKYGIKEAIHDVVGKIDGYTIYRNKGHKYFFIYFNGKGIRLHRYLIEKKLGRKLKRNEHVHHIDFNPQNNNLSNLQLLSSSEHEQLHGKIVSNRFFRKCNDCGKEVSYPNHLKDKVNNIFRCMDCKMSNPKYIKSKEKYQEFKNQCELLGVNTTKAWKEKTRLAKVRDVLLQRLGRSK